MSFVDKRKLYSDLLSAYTKAYSDNKSKKTIQEDVNRFWNNVKREIDVKNLVDNEIASLNKIKAKKQVFFQKFWLDANENQNDRSNKSLPSVDKENKINSPNIIIGSPVDEVRVHDETEKKHLTPAQDKLKTELLILDSDVTALTNRVDCGLITEETVSELKMKKTKLVQVRNALKKREKEMLRHRKRRLQHKTNMKKACDENPSLKKKLKIRGANGRPRIECDQPHLLSAIVELALHGSAAHERRRDETIRTVKTLDDLVNKLHEDYGITLSRTAAYLRLLPRKSNSAEGKRHITTVPVKLAKSSNDTHKQHIDTKFAMTTINHICQIASLLGPNEVTYMSQDDKAKIPVGLPAVNAQAPLLMHMQYR